VHSIDLQGEFGHYVLLFMFDDTGGGEGRGFPCPKIWTCGTRGSGEVLLLDINISHRFVFDSL
jgi:hypothetical protein